MVNRGVNGDTATDMLARFEQGVIAEKPDLVLWQVGTNSLLRGDPIQPHRSLLHGGIVRLKAIGADIVLIDPQYAPRVLARPNAEEMVELLEQTARFETVNLFRRFALMRHWHQVERMPFEAFLSPDELHMNDFSYGCVARALGGAIAEAVTRPVLSATAPAERRRQALRLHTLDLDVTVPRAPSPLPACGERSTRKARRVRGAIERARSL